MASDERSYRLIELAVFCSGLIPTKVGTYPNADDGIELANDLRLLAGKVDAVIAAYGSYAESRIGNVDQSLFVDQLADALTGNAIYEIEAAADEREKADAEPDPDHAYDRMRDERMEPQS